MLVFSGISLAQNKSAFIVEIGSRVENDRYLSTSFYTKVADYGDSQRVTYYEAKISQIRILDSGNRCTTVQILKGGPGFNFIERRVITPASCKNVDVSIEVYGVPDNSTLLR